MRLADPDRIATGMSARCGSGAPVAVRLLDVGSDNGGFVGAVREPPLRGGGCGRDLVCRNRISPHRTILEPSPIPVRSHRPT